MMQIGYIGLGKMGLNMTERLIEKGHDVFAFDINEESRKNAESIGAKTYSSISELAQALPSPQVFWIMVPHQVVDRVVEELTPNLKEGDTVIDGGNSPYKLSVDRAQKFSKRGVHFLDAGISGGPEGARTGACVMVGGREEDYKGLEDLFKDLSAENGYAYVGTHGAGHFVKMVHNGIEYGMMQSIAEGFTIMKQSEFNLDLQKIAELYNHQSVVESRLVRWLRDAFEEFSQEMKDVSGTVSHSGEGEWTVETAKELNIPIPIIEGAFQFRKDSKEAPSYTGKLLSGMRNQFGGHDIKQKY